MAPAARDDEVDLVIDAWSRYLPDVDLTPLDVMSRLRRVSLRLARVRASAVASAGLASWEFDVLAALRRRPEPHELNPAQLIEVTMIGSAAMTNRLDKLTTRRLVERRPNDLDRRSILVRLTDDGAERVDAAMTELARLEAEELGVLSQQDQATLARILRQLLEGHPAR